MNESIYPIKLSPFLKEVVWGGTRLREFGKRIAKNAHIGESWDLSDRPGSASVVANGKFQGEELSHIIEKHARLFLGTLEGRRLPLLIKFLDAEGRLSVQVHPDEKVARQLKGEPKTEAWIVLAAEPSAQLIFGLTPGTTRKDLRRALKIKGEIRKYLNFVPVHEGDVFLIRPGTVHALLEGIVVFEVQESSDTTYRVYDWDRLGLDGRPRELHVEAALKAIVFETAQIGKIAAVDFKDFSQPAEILPLIAVPQFNVTLLKLWKEELPRKVVGRPLCYTGIWGEGTVECNGVEEPLAKGDSILIPGMADACCLRSDTHLALIETTSNSLPPRTYTPVKY